MFGQARQEGGEGGEKGGREEGEEEATVLGGPLVVHVMEKSVRVTGGGEGREDVGGGATRGKARPIVRVDTHLDQLDFLGKGEGGGARETAAAAAAAGGSGECCGYGGSEVKAEGEVYVFGE